MVTLSLVGTRSLSRNEFRMDKVRNKTGLEQFTWGQFFKADFGIIYIKNGFNKLNFTLNYINFDVI